MDEEEQGWLVGLVYALKVLLAVVAILSVIFIKPDGIPEAIALGAAAGVAIGLLLCNFISSKKTRL